MSTVLASYLHTQDIRYDSSSGPALIIDSDGIASFRNSGLLYYGWRDTGVEAWENFGTTAVTYVYNVEQQNTNSYYNTSTGVFTCPYAGVYFVSPSALFGQGGSYGYLFVYKNGLNETARGIHSNTNGLNLWHIQNYTFPINCAANDQLTVKITTGNANVYGREHSHLAIWTK